MRTYPKIDTAFDRDEAFKVDTTRLRRPVVASIATWRVSEKVDGTNIRIHFARDEVDDVGPRIAGRTDNAQLHPGLLDHVRMIAEEVEPEVEAIGSEFSLPSLTLYGEGYGAKIQSGGAYRPDQGFILFDVLAGGRWLGFDQVLDTGKRLGIPVVPDFGEMAWDEAVNLAREGFESRCSVQPRPAEGLVLRTVEPLYDNRGERIIVKLKTKDFA